MIGCSHVAIDYMINKVFATLLHCEQGWKSLAISGVIRENQFQTGK